MGFTGHVRISEFWRLMDDEFGAGRARMLASAQALTVFGGQTPDQLLEKGEDPRRIWEALAEQMGVPQERWLGEDLPLITNPDKY